MVGWDETCLDSLDPDQWYGQVPRTVGPRMLVETVVTIRRDGGDHIPTPRELKVLARMTEESTS